MKLTAEELGRYIGVSQQQISCYESGVNHINIDFYLNYLSYLKYQFKFFNRRLNIFLIIKNSISFLVFDF